MTQANNVEENRKFYYYYPGWNEKFPRRVLAGLVRDGVIHVGEAICFPGMKPVLVPVKLRGGQFVYIVDPGPKPDIFSKKEGKKKAEERAQGYLYKTKKNGDRIYIGDQAILKVPLPTTGDVNPGKVFVEAVEAHLAYHGFPARPLKAKKPKDGPAAGCTAAPLD